VTVRLHNRTGGGTDNLVRTYNDGVTNPDGPGTLADFNGTEVNGPWTLTVRDNASQDVGTLNSWTLKIASTGGNCPTQEVIYSFPLDTNPGWTLQGQWEYGVPQGACGDPTSGYTGPNVYGYNLSGCYPDNLSPVQYLTTTAIDCSGITNAKLRFRRWLGIESSAYDHASIEVSNNGSAWTTVYNFSGATMTESSWSLQSYNIASIADGQPTVYLRWGMGTTDASVVYSGWNIDDIEILGVPSCAGALNGDVNDDTKIDGDDIDGFTRAYVTPSLVSTREKCAADMDDDGDVDDDDLDLFLHALLN
jgi:hypothetical protein